MTPAIIKLIVILVLGLSLSGCALVAAGVIGGAIVAASNNNSPCWDGYEYVPCYGYYARYHRHHGRLLKNH
jgi:hypothetical protein